MMRRSAACWRVRRLKLIRAAELDRSNPAGDATVLDGVIAIRIMREDPGVQVRIIVQIGRGSHLVHEWRWTGTVQLNDDRIVF